MSDLGEDDLRRMTDWVKTEAARIGGAFAECVVSATGRSAFVDIYVVKGVGRMTLHAEGYLDSEVIGGSGETIYCTHRAGVTSVDSLASEFAALLPHLRSLS